MPSVWFAVSLFAIILASANGESCIDVLNRKQEANAARPEPLLGDTGPWCDENDDTLYGPIQCIGSVCYCARADNGEKIGDYEFNIGSRTSCRCARDQVENGYTGDCQPNGEHWLF